MEAYKIVNALNQLLAAGDLLDNAGSGVKGLTNGKNTTREAIRLELFNFLIYIANGNFMFEGDEIALLNLVLGVDSTAYRLKQVAKQMDNPDPISLTLQGFLSGDMALTQQNGYKSTSFTDLLITAFETFGNLMVAFDENSVSKARCAKYINGMKSYVSKNLR